LSPSEILTYKDDINKINGITIKKLLINKNISIYNQFDYLISNIDDNKEVYIYEVNINKTLEINNKVKL